MPKFEVCFIQYHNYEVEAENERDAIDLASDDFHSEMRRPIAHTYYDEVEVEELED